LDFDPNFFQLSNAVFASKFWIFSNLIDISLDFSCWSEDSIYFECKISI